MHERDTTTEKEFDTVLEMRHEMQRRNANNPDESKWFQNE